VPRGLRSHVAIRVADSTCHLLLPSEGHPADPCTYSSRWQSVGIICYQL